MAPDVENTGKSVMDGPTSPAHANLTEPKGSTACLNCGYVFAGRANCPNCGYEMTNEQIKEVNEHRAKVNIPPSLLRR